MRRVLDAEVKNGTLKLAVQRLGQSRPTKLEICRERDRRSPSAKKAARASYEQKLRRSPGATLSRLHHYSSLTTRSIWRSLSVPSMRGDCCGKASRRSRFWESMPPRRRPPSMRRSRSAFCGSTPAASLLRESFWSRDFTCLCRMACSALVRERMANLNRAAAKWSLFELDERHDALMEIDCSDRGNVVDAAGTCDQ